MKNVSVYVVENKGVWYVDKIDIDTDEVVVKPGEKVVFISDDKTYVATVSKKVVGRDDDMYVLTNVEKT